MVCVCIYIYIKLYIFFEELECVKQWESHAEWHVPRTGNVYSTRGRLVCVSRPFAFMGSTFLCK